MAHDPELAELIRVSLADRGVEPVREVKMFGGLSFMVNDKLAISANTHGDLMIRCEPDRVDELLTRTGAQEAEMKGRKMSRGWIRIQPEGYATEADFDGWIDAALGVDRSG